MAKIRLVLEAGLVSACLVVLQPSPQAQGGHSEWSAPVNLGPVINSAGTETAPELSKNGLALYFATNRLSNGGISDTWDIWVSLRAKRDVEWDEPFSLGPAINTEAYNEIGPAFSRDGHWLFFQSNRPGFGAGDLWASWRQHTSNALGWTVPENLGTAVNTQFGEAAPTFFEGDDGIPAELYFTSGRPRPGGSRDEDIYVSVLDGNGQFGPPTRVAELCSPFNDGGPTISHNGLELYFASDRAGSFDIYVSRRDSLLEPWSAPVSLAIANSLSGEAHPTLSADGTMLIFNSNRPGGYGGHDLYVMARTIGGLGQ